MLHSRLVSDCRQGDRAHAESMSCWQEHHVTVASRLGECCGSPAGQSTGALLPACTTHVAEGVETCRSKSKKLSRWQRGLDSAQSKLLLQLIAYGCRTRRDCRHMMLYRSAHGAEERSTRRSIVAQRDSPMTTSQPVGRTSCFSKTLPPSGMPALTARPMYSATMPCSNTRWCSQR